MDAHVEYELRKIHDLTGVAVTRLEDFVSHCGYAFSQLPGQPRISDSTTGAWDRGAFRHLCGKPACLMCVYPWGCSFYCADCFLRDLTVANMAYMIVRLPGFDMREGQYLHENRGVLTDYVWDQWPTLTAFARAVSVWTKTLADQERGHAAVGGNVGVLGN